MGLFVKRQLLPALCVVLLAACDDAAERRPVSVGAPAPAFQAVTLQGDSIALADMRGDAVLVNIWATWCPPCRQEMPGLQALHEEYAGEGLHVLGVSIDSRSAGRDVATFTEDFGLTFPILLDPEERVTRVFRTTGVPETFLIDREGEIVRRWIGLFDPMAEDTRASVAEALRPRMERSS